MDESQPTEPDPVEGLFSQGLPEERAKKLLAEVEEFFTRAKEERKPWESAWFAAASMLRGQQRAHFSQIAGGMVTPPAPSHRVRLTINKIRPKIKARIAKFTKNRPVPIVVPASTDREDRLNASATQKVLDYLWRKLNLESKFKQALLWATISSKGFWWIYWDAEALGRVKVPVEGLPGQTEIQEAALGDVAVEVGSPFEIFVDDLAIPYIGDQPRILRVKVRPLEDMKIRYPALAEKLKADATPGESTFEKQIANLNGKSQGYGATRDTKPANAITVKEFFERPCAKYPKGRYVVVAGDQVVKAEEALPFGFHDLENPYPVVEFNDSISVGQFWNTTLIEQLQDIQREYNLVRSMVAETLKLMARPKILVYKQHQLAKGSWGSEPGEIVEVVGIPGLPPPQVLQPANIASDAWQTLNLLRQEFDDLSHIYPASEGKTGAATSGFQTNLLQEAADSVHAPEIREHELAVEAAAYKFRRLMKLGYDVPRLVTITGRNFEPDVLEFSKSQIDEYADIVVKAGSALPDLPAARIQGILELFDKGILGDQADPEVKRRALSMLDMKGLEVAYEEAKRDEDEARRENATVAEGGQLEMAQFYHDHIVHMSVHADMLKSPEAMNWDPQRRLGLVAHLITHVDFQNPQLAMQLRMVYGLTEMPPALPPPMPPPGMDPGAQGPPQGGPPQGGPPPGPPPPQ